MRIKQEERHNMRVKLAFDDWRQIEKDESIYSEELGINLSTGDLHSGTIFDCEIKFDDPEIEEEIKKAMREHGAYPVFSVMPIVARRLKLTSKQLRAACERASKNVENIVRWDNPKRSKKEE